MHNLDALLEGLGEDMQVRSNSSTRQNSWYIRCVGLDVTRRPTLFPPTWFPRHWFHEDGTICRYSTRFDAILWYPIPSRSNALHEEKKSSVLSYSAYVGVERIGRWYEPTPLLVVVLTFDAQEEFIGKEIARIREICGPKGRVIGAVSGGVDSTVAAKLMHEAIGDRFAFVIADMPIPFT